MFDMEDAVGQAGSLILLDVYLGKPSTESIPLPEALAAIRAYHRAFEAGRVDGRLGQKKKPALKIRESRARTWHECAPEHRCFACRERSRAC